jgi:hypothetical protein
MLIFRMKNFVVKGLTELAANVKKDRESFVQIAPPCRVRVPAPATVILPVNKLGLGKKVGWSWHR